MGERKWHSIWRKTHAFPMESLWWVSMSDPEESLWKLLILETKGLQQTIDCSTLSHGLTAFMYYNQNVHLNKEKKKHWTLKQTEAQSFNHQMSMSISILYSVFQTYIFQPNVTKPSSSASLTNRVFFSVLS